MGSFESNLQVIKSKIANNSHLRFSTLAWKGLKYTASALKTRYYLRNVNTIGVGVVIDGLSPKIDNTGTIHIGNDVVFLGSITPVYMCVSANATLEIGHSTFMNDAVWIGCTGKVSIGPRCLLGPGVKIIDNNYHNLYDRHVRPDPRPVTIGSDVWITTGATILPGVTIGRGAVIAAGSIVTNSVEAYTIVAGNPAKEIRRINREYFEQQLASHDQSE